MGQYSSASTKNLVSHRSGSRNGSEGVRDSMNMGMKKYGRAGDYQPAAGSNPGLPRPYVKGNCYNVELGTNNQVMNSPRISHDDLPPSGLGSRMSPRNQAAAAG